MINTPVIIYLFISNKQAVYDTKIYLYVLQSQHETYEKILKSEVPTNDSWNKLKEFSILCVIKKKYRWSREYFNLKYPGADACRTELDIE